MQPDGAEQHAAALLQALHGISGQVGRTKVEAGIFVSLVGSKGKPWSLSDTKVEGGRVFARLGCMERGLAKFAGADLKKKHPLEQNQFLKNLRDERNKAVTTLMVDKLSENQAYRTKLVRKEMIDDIARVVDVAVDGFYDDDEFVAGQTLAMLTTSVVSDCPYIEVKPSSMEFVRRGIDATLNAPVEKRKRPRHAVGEAFPAARFEARRGFVYCRYRTADDKWVQKSFPVKSSDHEGIMDERRREAQARAQAFYVDHHVPKPVGADGDDESEPDSENAGNNIASDDGAVNEQETHDM